MIKNFTKNLHLFLAIFLAFTAWSLGFSNPTQAQTTSSTVSVDMGWNLLGNGTTAPIDVFSKLNDDNNVQTVWKWNAATSTWAFYTPVQADGGAAYAASKGYEPLTTIYPGEGYWVNAKASFSLPASLATSYSYSNLMSTSATAMLSGWNLLSIGDVISPSVFNLNLSLVPPTTGNIPENVTTLWAWDAVSENPGWYFYSPYLDGKGTLQSYIASKGYKDFATKAFKLQDGVGFWVNNPATGLTTVKGLLTGLDSGKSIRLVNAGISQNISFNGEFSFTTTVGSSYSIAVQKQPAGQICTVSNGSGISGSAENKVLVSCPSTPIQSSTTTTTTTTTTTVASSTTTTLPTNPGACKQLLGTAGNDIFNPIGFCNQELTLSPGNDTYNLGSAHNFQFSLIPNGFTPTSGVGINLTQNSLPINSQQVPPYTMVNGYGGVNKLNYIDGAQNYTTYFWSGPFNDYLIKDSGCVFWDIQPNSGNDTVISKGGCLSIDLFNFQNANITISGSTGSIQPDATTSLNFEGVSGWNFWNGIYNIVTGASNLSIYFWNVSNDPKFANQNVSGGGNFQTFGASTANIIINISDFNSTDKLSPQFLNNYGQSSITKALIDSSISMVSDINLNKTTVTFSNNSAAQGTSGKSSFVVNGIYNSYVVNGDNTVSLSLNSQFITFNQPSAMTIGAAYTPIAVSSSGLSVSFNSLTPNVCSFTGGNLKALSAGTCTINAIQNGNGNYAAAAIVTRSFAVNPANQTITFVQPSVATVGATATLSASSSSGLPISFTSTTTGICTLSGSTLTAVASGTCSIIASQAGNGTYAAAPSVTQSFAINPADQAVSSKTYIVSTFAGSGQPGNANGTGLNAFFNGAQGIAIDSLGNLYVADTQNHLIRKISPSGVVVTIAGSGTAGNSNGVGANASFNQPSGIAVDSTGNIFVADYGNNLIRKITPGGTVSTLAGNGVAGYTDSPSGSNNGLTASFHSPVGIALDASGNIYVSENFNSVIRLVRSNGVTSTLAGSGHNGFSNGVGASASLNSPWHIVFDGSGSLYVADSGNNAVRKVDILTGTVSTVLQNNSIGPFGITVDGLGNIYIFTACEIKKITMPGAEMNSFAGAYATGNYINGAATSATFNWGRSGMVFDPLGNMFVADAGNNVIRKVSAP